MKHLLTAALLLITFPTVAKATTVPTCERLIGVWQCVTHMSYGEPMKAAQSGYILHGFKDRFRNLTTPGARAKASAACGRELTLFRRYTILRPADSQLTRLNKQIYAACYKAPHKPTQHKTYYTSAPTCSIAASVATCVASNLPRLQARTSINGLMGYVVTVLKRVPLGRPAPASATPACQQQINNWVIAVKRTKFRGATAGTRILRKCLRRARVIR
jgi:hypothetical protein